MAGCSHPFQSRTSFLSQSCVDVLFAQDKLTAFQLEAWAAEMACPQQQQVSRET